MSPAQPDARMLAAPKHLGLDTRSAFRRDAVTLLDAMPEGDGALIIDLGKTDGMDSAGLNALILIGRHAARRRQHVRLANVSDELRGLLALTKLDHRFEAEARA